MKVAIDITAMFYDRSGIPRYMAGLLSGLSALDFDDRYFLFYDTGFDGELDADELNLPEDPRFERVPLTPYTRFQRQWQNWFCMPYLPRGTPACRIHRPPGVSSPYAHIPDAEVFHFPNYVVPRGSSVPTVVTIHDVCWEINPSWFTREGVRYWRRHVPGSVRRASKVISVSERTGEDLVSRYGVSAEKIHVIPEAAETFFSQTANPDEDSRILSELGVRQPFFLCVATREPRKNLSLALRVFARTRTEEPQPQLVLAGEAGWKEDELQRMLKRVGGGDGVLVTGRLSDAALTALYRTCRVFLYPSLYEGFGLPVLEAMTCGAPVISSGRGALNEVSGEAAVIVEPTDEDGWVRATLRLLQDEDEFRRRADLCRERASYFSWTQTAESTRRIYDLILNGDPKP